MSWFTRLELNSLIGILLIAVAGFMVWALAIVDAERKDAGRKGKS